VSPITAAELQVPMTPLEHMLAKIWQEVLGVEGVSADDNFFVLGGHSLKAMQVVARVHRESGQQISLVDMFRTGTLRELAAVVDSKLT
jgi:acyl carrier protein